jgi:hypothetical protein
MLRLSCTFAKSNWNTLDRAFNDSVYFSPRGTGWGRGGSVLVALVTDSRDVEHFLSSMRATASFLEGFVGDLRVKAAREQQPGAGN